MVRRSTGATQQRFQALDMLATLVSVVDDDGRLLFANNALEDAIGLSRRSLLGVPLTDWFTAPELLQNALQGSHGHEYAVIRYDAFLKRLNHEPLPVHVVGPRAMRRVRWWWRCCRWSSRPARSAKSA